MKDSYIAVDFRTTVDKRFKSRADELNAAFDNRLPHECDFEAAVYRHGTHFVFPESMLKMILPVGSELVVKHAFKAAREYPRECRAAREDIDRRMTNAIEQWKRAEISCRGKARMALPGA